MEKSACDVGIDQKGQYQRFGDDSGIEVEVIGTGTTLQVDQFRFVSNVRFSEFSLVRRIRPLSVAVGPDRSKYIHYKQFERKKYSRKETYVLIMNDLCRVNYVSTFTDNVVHVLWKAVHV